MLSTLGNLREKDDPRLAIHFHRLSLESGERIGDSIIRQAARTNIGYAHLTLGEPDQALPHFETCMRLLTGNDDWHHESQARLGLVRSLHGLRRDEEADRECQALLGQAAERGDTYAQGLAQHVRGLILDARGRRAEAVAHWQEALRALALHRLPAGRRAGGAARAGRAGRARPGAAPGDRALPALRRVGGGRPALTAAHAARLTARRTTAVSARVTPSGPSVPVVKR